MPARMREAAEPEAETERLTPRLSIGEISRLTNVSPSTLRDWESHGIIAPLRQGKRRQYTMADVERVRTASALRRQSFSPAAIAATLAPGAPDTAPAGSHAIETGRILRQARLERGSSLREVASAVNISVSHLSTVERGGVQPGLALLQRLAACYSIDVADLFGGPSADGPKVRKWSESDVLLSDEGRVRVPGRGPLGHDLQRHVRGRSRRRVRRLLRARWRGVRAGPRGHGGVRVRRLAHDGAGARRVGVVQLADSAPVGEQRAGPAPDDLD